MILTYCVDFERGMYWIVRDLGLTC